MSSGKVIFANIFRNARQRVCIAANTLRNEVVDSSEYQDALDVFLGNGGSELQIIISHLPNNATEDSSNNIYRRLQHHPAYLAGRIHIRNANRPLFTLGNKPANFCVADGLMSRIENDIEKRTALCNFGNAKRAQELEEIFRRGYDSLQSEVNLNSMFAQ